MSDSDEDDFATPLELSQTAANITLLPSKSREIYEKSYNDLMKWCSNRNIQYFTEDTMLSYFLEKAQCQKSSSLWSLYSKLKATLIFNNNVDISKYSQLLDFLKKQATGYKPKKSKVFTREEIFRFLMEAPDEIYLMTKVALILGISGACRTTELLALSINDVQNVGEESLLVTIKDTKSKMDRVFTVVTNKNNPINYVQMIKAYMGLRKVETQHTRFFVNYKNNKCTVQPVGKNILSKLPERIANYLKLQNASQYTGRCFRRCSPTLLTDIGADIATLKRYVGWKSINAYEGAKKREQTYKQDQNEITQQSQALPLGMPPIESSNSGLYCPAIASTSRISTPPAPVPKKPICILCCTEVSPRITHSIEEYSEIILALCKIDIREYEVPLVGCKSCIKDLIVINKFKNVVEQSRSIFKEYIDGMENTSDMPEKPVETVTVPMAPQIKIEIEEASIKIEPEFVFVDSLNQESYESTPKYEMVQPQHLPSTSTSTARKRPKEVHQISAFSTSAPDLEKYSQNEQLNDTFVPPSEFSSIPSTSQTINEVPFLSDMSQSSTPSSDNISEGVQFKKIKLEHQESESDTVGT